MTSQNIIPSEERIFPVYDNHGDLNQYVKELVWEVGPYQLIIRYFSQDKEDFSSSFGHTIKIKNNSKFKIDLTPIKSWDDGYYIYTYIEASMFSGYANNAEELEELSQAIHDAAEAERVFTKVLKERF